MCQERSYGRVPDTTRVREAAPGVFCWRPSVSPAGDQNDHRRSFHESTGNIARYSIDRRGCGCDNPPAGPPADGGQQRAIAIGIAERFPTRPDGQKQGWVASRAGRIGQSGSQAGSTTGTPAAGMSGQPAEMKTMKYTGDAGGPGVRFSDGFVGGRAVGHEDCGDGGLNSGKLDLDSSLGVGQPVLGERVSGNCELADPGLENGQRSDGAVRPRWEPARSGWVEDE